MKFSKFLVTTVCAVTIVSSSLSAYAECEFWGCNIVDDGKFNQIHVGQALYRDVQFSENIKVVVQAIRSDTKEVYVRDDRGRQYWVKAADLYTFDRVQQRDNTEIAAGIFGVLAFLSASSNGSKSKSYASPAKDRSSAGSTSGSSYDQELARQQTSSSSADYHSAREDTSVGCAWGDRAYGTCH